MSDFGAWSALQSAMQQEGSSGASVDRRTWRRVAEFARPHRRTIVAFLVLATVSAVLGVRRPVLAGRAVDAIVEGDSGARSWRWRCSSPSWPSSTPSSACSSGCSRPASGEGLILDLRRRVFEHVQRMPIAFFTRTHTGALVSRLNNDVIGAQRAFTSALVGRRHQRDRPRADARA